MSRLQRAEWLDLVLAGPDPEINGVVRWRCVDLKGEVERRFGVKAMATLSPAACTNWAKPVCSRARIIPFWRDLSRPRRRSGHDHALCQYRGHE